MSDDITLTIGDFEFDGFEIPDEIPTPTRQALKVHRKVGGKKTVDAMGAFVDAISWSGRFRGPDADDRRDQVNAMAIAGQQLPLTWGSRAFTVVIEVFTPGHRGNDEIPYSITCEVISDDADPNVSDQSISPDEMIGSDVDAAQAASLSVVAGQGPLAAAMASVQSAVGAVTDFARATRDALNSVLQPIASAQSLVQGLIGDAETVISSVGAIGGVLPGVRGVDLVSGVLGQMTAMSDAASLYDVQNFLGRAQVNLNSIGNSGAHVLIAGGDLFKIASTVYGDASEWATIADANGLTDPLIDGLQEITIPPSPLGTGGILS